MADMTMNNMHQAVRETVRVHSGLFLAQGILTTLLGVAAVIWPQISTLAVELYVGWIFLISGAAGVFMMFFAPNVSAFLWTLLTAALSLFAGVVLVWHPVEGAVSLTLLLVAFFIAEGVFQIAAALSYRTAFPDSWGWMLSSGIADIILALLLIAGWPSSASWALGLIVGVNLITSGVATIVVTSAVRRAVR